MPVTQVHDPNVVSGMITQHPVERVQDRRRAAPAVGAQNAKIHEIRIGSDACVLGIGHATVARGNRGYMSSMSVRIIRAPFTEDPEASRPART